jgi:hypothetical protein
MRIAVFPALHKHNLLDGDKIRSMSDGIGLVQISRK